MKTVCRLLLSSEIVMNVKKIDHKRWIQNTLLSRGIHFERQERQ